MTLIYLFACIIIIIIMTIHKFVQTQQVCVAAKYTLSTWSGKHFDNKKSFSLHANLCFMKLWWLFERVAKNVFGFRNAWRSNNCISHTIQVFSTNFHYVSLYISYCQTLRCYYWPTSHSPFYKVVRISMGLFVGYAASVLVVDAIESISSKQRETRVWSRQGERERTRGLVVVNDNN